jgi:hypothetical protein
VTCDRILDPRLYSSASSSRFGAAHHVQKHAVDLLAQPNLTEMRAVDVFVNVLVYGLLLLFVIAAAGIYFGIILVAFLGVDF